MSPSSLSCSGRVLRVAGLHGALGEGQALGRRGRRSGAAIAIASSISASSGTHFQIRPHCSAFSALSFSPSMAMPMARAWPTRRGRCQVPPVSGIRPSLQNTSTKLADSRRQHDVAGQRQVGARAGGHAVDGADRPASAARAASAPAGRSSCSTECAQVDAAARPVRRRGRTGPGRRKSRGRRRSAAARARVAVGLTVRPARRALRGASPG